MLLKHISIVTTFAVAAVASSAWAEEFRLSSTSIAEGAKLSPTQVFEGFGCHGGNQSPQLTWTNAPVGTKSYAITAYDPDAPTGSGWWHWNVVNIPASVTELPTDASRKGALPKGAMEIRNDYGVSGFGGACPPPGEMHRYIFTVHALGIDKLDLPKEASNALAGFMIRANSIGKASITAVYNR
ncbi:YbhB/YbcL family Raf kinase inhibitor-like protein [Candidatus Phycosocius spiralis]|uniref:YbhB/YbcL family Raf kinase inhibitor-like protein n=1 Tax=Candidatus Phycosocius spiralis TaxID=2815099 RepID=UPI0024E06A10|nr:YbhB/YbcL family Raf kinase inhibitor-like protein [Candidatus Phycosocius spiralis]